MPLRLYKVWLTDIESFTSETITGFCTISQKASYLASMGFVGVVDAC